MIRTETRIINNQEYTLFFDTNLKNYLVASDAMEIFLENMQKSKESETSEVLILKADLLLSKDHLAHIREDIIEQIKEGVVVIPSGFSYEIWKLDNCMHREEKKYIPISIDELEDICDGAASVREAKELLIERLQKQEGE